MNVVWFALGIIVGFFVNKYKDNKEFKDKVNQYIKRLFIKKPPAT